MHHDADKTEDYRPSNAATPDDDAPGHAIHSAPTVSGGAAAVRFTASAAEATPPVLPGYRTIGALGVGGMGVVWKAEQIAARRVVALKVINAAAAGSARAAARFKREVALAANLEHPNIARVYDSGVDRGAWYYAMEYVDGVPLDRYLADAGADGRRIVATLMTVARAMQFAHQRGVIHRDLKPSNVLVAKGDGTKEGTVKLLDFGLAKAIGTSEGDDGEDGEGDEHFAAPAAGHSPALSTAGDVMGTVDYMSPEQARGEVARVDTRTDVYALGVILFRLLSGRLPRDDSGPVDVRLRRIGYVRPPRPRAIAPTIDAELEAVLLKAMAMEPEGRYPSAGELADDLQRYLKGDPLLARPQTTTYFLTRRAIQYRWQVAAALAVVVAIAVAATMYVRDIAEARTRAEQALQKADYGGLVAAERLALTLATLKDFIFLSVAPGNGQGEDGDPLVAAEVRLRLMPAALNALDRLARGATENPADVDRTSGAALAQVAAAQAALGQVDAARRSYDQAARRLDAVAAADSTPAPIRAAARGDRVTVRVALARMHLDGGRLDEANAELANARVALADLKGAPAYRRNAWVVALAEGDLLAAQDRPGDAVVAYDRALALLPPASASASAGVRDLSRDRAVTSQRLAAACVRAAAAAAPSDSARTGLARRALELLRPLAQLPSPATTRPAGHDARRALAATLVLVAEASALVGDGAHATDAADRAVELLRLVPGGGDVRSDLAAALYARGNARRAAGDARGARADDEEILALLESTAGAASDRAHFTTRHARMLQTVRQRLARD